MYVFSGTMINEVIIPTNEGIMLYKYLYIYMLINYTSLLTLEKQISHKIHFRNLKRNVVHKITHLDFLIRKLKSFIILEQQMGKCQIELVMYLLVVNTISNLNKNRFGSMLNKHCPMFNCFFQNQMHKNTEVNLSK